MTKSDYELVIRHYFQMWVKRDFTHLDKLFAADIYYSECYGPEYFGLSEIYRWIDDMLAKQTVLAWEIKQFIHEPSTNTVVVEWYFKEQQKLDVNDFNGVSIIKFTPEGKICVIKEFESKSEHVAPFH
ncbi:nuclear transport factor 2 family protein [Photobacterium andalusiense]|uniref:SnoaL-like domain protein n=1 Tax=Photobacterium andalusiense TaxID=2204296 RepID=A0A1Y6MAC5_9GAMM|nr:nuclear transport factor 2 family protein [Photobacterium andalusiense]SMY32869.1 SnoaL-like domain protein [Photobacterium andalusiense]